ncbi:phosphatidylserine decarboxylase [Gracilibacillus sp. S3-1-1]|uniref:Phosphatidylserine decarboxylase n=1 Tax=Gracilibacillus pellucidus TaxID=3095368 RepID=A0ACC6M2Y0_9BACI|nr:phosphatidylserine decarboxylase [Gracilibacillus sp. S3-1-1]MDX8045292.1 phosphatidylserine decarboxylase [Gracilibacillus sp. S3-1-1]
MLKFLLKSLVELTGNRFVSRKLATFTESKYSKFLVPAFASIYKIDQEEMRDPLSSYPSVQALFTRKLKQDLRPIDSHEASAVSPVDGVLNDYGTIQDGIAFSVKGKQLSIDELLGSKTKASRYNGGSYMVIYLSPQHYHRIHSPVSGRIVDNYTLGGKSYPVNKLGEKYGKRPLSTNYRRITEVDTEHGFCAIVKVGALNINSIQLTYEGNKLVKGQEIGYFSFGSTVILLFEQLSFSTLAVEQALKVGERIGLFN